MESVVRWATPTTRARAGLLVAVAALSALSALALAPTLAVGFEADDRVDAVDNPAARPSTFVAALGTTNRPLVKATYALQRLAGGDAARAYHAVNLVLHLACAVAVFFWLRRVLAWRRPATATPIAWLLAALWSVHPAAVETVAPVVGRSVLLSTLALVAALLVATRPRLPGGPAMAAAGGLAAAAVAARETALVLPALALLWQVTAGALEGRRRAFVRQLPLLAGGLAGALVVAASARHRELLAFSLATRAPLDALRGNVVAVPRLLALWFAPGRLSVDPAQPLDLPWSAPAVWRSALALLLLAAAAVALRRAAPRAALALGWTLLALAPSNSVVWRLDPVAPRALYLASIGIVLGGALMLEAVVASLGAASRHATRWPVALRAGVVGLVLALVPVAAAAHARAVLWTSPLRLWADAALKAPETSRPWLGLGLALMNEGRLDEAALALERARRLDPEESRVHCVLEALRVRRSQPATERRLPP